MSLPSTVQACYIDKTGGPEEIKHGTLPFPKVEPDHIVVKVEYMGVNFIDTYFRQGLYPLKSFPAIIGKEPAGTIVQLPSSSDVTNSEEYKRQGFEIGMKVVADCQGGCATYVSTPWTKIWPVVPSSIGTRTASASLVSGITVLTFATESYNISAKDTVLIHTAAGAFGLIMTQVAKSRGAKVIGTTSTKEKAKLCKDNGIDEVILYKDENTVKRVLEITNGQGVDVIYDGVGKDTFESDFEMIKRKGTLVCVGNASGAIPPFSPLKLMAKNIKLLRPTAFTYTVTPDEVYDYGRLLFKLIDEGVIKINIWKEYAFTAEALAESHRDLVSGKGTGKGIVKIQ